jgi:hypothetical protein
LLVAALDLYLCAFSELRPADAALKMLSGRISFRLPYPGLKTWAVLFSHFMAVKSSQMTDGESYVISRTGH